MTPEQFAYWLQGFFELNEADGKKSKALTAKQVKMIREHLQLVFSQSSTKPAEPTVDIDEIFKRVDPAPYQPPAIPAVPYAPPPGVVPWEHPWRPFEIICGEPRTYCHGEASCAQYDS